MESENENHIWERTDDNFCSYGYQMSEGYHYIYEDSEEIRVVDVIYDANDPGFTKAPIRIIAQQPPPFGEWQRIDDDELLSLRLSERVAAEEQRMNSVEAERDRRIAHLKALTGYKAREYEESLDRAVYSFNLNATALITLAAQYVASETDADLGEHFNYRLANALFNFLASVGTLRDVQRVVHRKIWPMRQAEPVVCDSCRKTLKGPLASVWEEEVYGPKLKETFGNDAAFLLKLRDYAIHYELPMPSLTTKMSWGKDQPYVFEKTFPLSRQELLKWSSWNSGAKAYMAEQGDWIDFREVISSYTRSVRAFHSWFWEQVSAEINLAEYIGKADELRLWLNEKDVRPDWIVENRPMPSNWNENGRSELRKKRIRAKIARWEHGTRSWTVHTVDASGSVTLGESDGWGTWPM